MERSDMVHLCKGGDSTQRALRPEESGKHDDGWQLTSLDAH